MDLNVGARADGSAGRNLIFPPASAVPESAVRLTELEARAGQAFANMGMPVGEIEAARVEILPETLANSVIGVRPLRPRRRMVDRQFGARRPQRNITGYIILSVQDSDDRWVSVASAVREGNPRLIRTLLFQTAILYLILLIPLIWLGRYISKPLKALTERAQNIRPGEGDPLVASGPPDTRQLTTAFNAMNERVGAMLDEKDVMLGAIGHDLRTPLAALRVRVENVEDEAERDRMIAGIEDMDRTLDDILSLVRGLVAAGNRRNRRISMRLSRPWSMSSPIWTRQSVSNVAHGQPRRFVRP